MKMAIDMIEGLRYKLRMMGIPLNGPTSVLQGTKRSLKMLIKTRTLVHLSEPYNSRSTMHTARQPRKDKFNPAHRVGQ
jgi:hypothetical protein